MIHPFGPTRKRRPPPGGSAAQPRPRTDLRPVLDFHEPDPTTFRRLPDASSTSVVRRPSGGSHYWNGGYVQTGGQFKQLGEGAKEVIPIPRELDSPGDSRIRSAVIQDGN